MNSEIDDNDKLSLYIDLCVYNRPFDNQADPKILLESLCFLFILSMVQAKEINLINSFVLEYENSNNPQIDNRVIISDMLNEANQYISYAPTIEERALDLEQQGIKHFDALHLSCAEYAKADYFISCDDNLIKKANKIIQMKIKVVSLLTFINTEVFNDAEH